MQNKVKFLDKIFKFQSRVQALSSCEEKNIFKLHSRNA